MVGQFQCQASAAQPQAGIFLGQLLDGGTQPDGGQRRAQAVGNGAQGVVRLVYAAQPAVQRQFIGRFGPVAGAGASLQGLQLPTHAGQDLPDFVVQFMGNVLPFAQAHPFALAHPALGLLATTHQFINIQHHTKQLTIARWPHLHQ